MCPQGTELLLITDQENLSKARNYLDQYAPTLRASLSCIDELSAEILI